MATAGEIVVAAYRESNIVSIASAPSTLERAEGVTRLNTLILSAIGNEAGTELKDLQIGGAYDQAPSDFAPPNSRLMLNLSGARTVKLNPLPQDGERFAVADAGANLATYNLTLDGNGRRIETAANVVLSTSSLARQWMFRADTGNWVRLTELTAADDMPFPVEFDDYFIVSLALRLNPRHSATLSQESQAALQRSQRQLRARYRPRRPQQDLGSLGLMGSSQGSDSGLLR